MSDRLNVAIIGFGRIGNEHSKWISQTPNARVAAVFDSTPARCQLASSQSHRVVESYDVILSDESIDAILISTPTSMHFDHAKRALEVRKHVMIEKPFAMSLAESKHLAALSGISRTVLSVFHNRRWDIDYLTLKSAIDSNSFGRVFNIESRLGQFASCVGPASREWNPNWRNELQFGGGALLDWGSHFLDQIWRIMLPAKPQTVFAHLRGNIWTKDADDFARVSIDFDNGATGLVEINTTTTRPLPRWHVDGENGSAQSPFSLAFDTSEWAKFTFTGTDGVTQALPLGSGGLSELQIWTQFAQACAGHGEPAVTAQSVLPTMALLDAARESSRSHELVRVDQAVFE